MKLGENYIDLTKTVTENLHNDDINKIQIDKEWNLKS